MSSILPQIEALQEVPSFHRYYAEFALNLIVKKLLEMKEPKIETFKDGEDEGSVMAFDADDFENVQMELRYFDYKFVIRIAEHDEEFDRSYFVYKIFEDSAFYKMIPEKIINQMKKAANDDDSISFM